MVEQGAFHKHYKHISRVNPPLFPNRILMMYYSIIYPLQSKHRKYGGNISGGNISRARNGERSRLVWGDNK